MSMLRINKSTSRTVDILNLIAETGRAMTIAEISQTLNIPKSSTFEILYTLVEKKYLEVEDERLKTFRLALGLFKTGITYLANTGLYREAHPYLEELMHLSDNTVFLAIEDQGRMVYLDKVEAASSVRTTIRLGGSKNPIYCSGLGKAYLAALPPERVLELVGDGALVPVTENTITSSQQLMVELEATRRRGYAIDNCEGNSEVYCVAAPLYDHSGRTLGAVSIASLAYKIDDEKTIHLGTMVAETALKISKRLGYMEEKLYPETK